LNYLNKEDTVEYITKYRKSETSGFHTWTSGRENIKNKLAWKLRGYILCRTFSTTGDF